MGDKDEAARQSWRETKVKKWEEGNEKLKATYPSRAELDEWVDSTCLNSKNKSLWKRTRAVKKKAAAEAATAPSGPPKLTQETARALLEKALTVFAVPANKERLTALVAECDAGPPESAQMMKMMKLMPAVQEMMADTLKDAGYAATDLMSVITQIMAFGPSDPTIQAGTEKLMKAAQGDLSGFS